MFRYKQIKGVRKNLNEVAIAMHESELEAQQRKENLLVYEQVSLRQTNDFINRVEQLRLSDSRRCLEYTPDVARPTEKYNAMIEEAESVYGDMDITNDLRYCTVFVDIARNLWRLQYSPSQDPKFDQRIHMSHIQKIIRRKARLS